MMMPRLLPFLSNRWVLAVIPATVVILLLPDLFSSYNIRLISSEFISGGVVIGYDDMDGDGNSELLQAGNFKHKTCFLLLKDHEKRFIDEWNFPGHLLSNDVPYATGDYDNNGYREAYVASYKDDSLFISRCEPLNKTDPEVHSRFLTLSLPGLSLYDFLFQPAGLSDLDGDGYKELVFVVCAGFCKQPRSIFAWNIRKDSILRSPLSAAQIMNPKMADLNRDGRAEIIVDCYAPGNCSPGEFPFCDSSAWLMVFNHRLEYRFEPLEFPGRTGMLSLFPYEENGQSLLIGKYSLFAKEKSENRLFKATPDDRILVSHQLDKTQSQVLNPVIFEKKHGHSLFMIAHQNKSMTEINSDFDTIGMVHIGEPSQDCVTMVYDLDGDGSRELLIRTGDGGLIQVFDRHMKKTASFSLPMRSYTPFFSNKTEAGKKKHFTFHNADNLLEYAYVMNPLAWLRIPFYAAVYLMSMLLIWLIQHLGRLQIQRQIRIKNKISELQTLVLQNQLDPHFILNAMNTVHASLSLGQHEAAGEKMGHFSRLIRSSLMDAGKTHRSLQEELDFVKAYLEVERGRMEYPFDYQIDVHKDIDPRMEIPKMLIQTFAENSVKHGLRPLNRKGELIIQIRRESESRETLISIEDNGIGRKKAGSSGTGGSGKGLDIISQLIRLHNELTKKNILYTIDDKMNKPDPHSGTSVEIRIPF